MVRFNESETYKLIQQTHTHTSTEHSLITPDVCLSAAWQRFSNQQSESAREADEAATHRSLLPLELQLGTEQPAPSDICSASYFNCPVASRRYINLCFSVWDAREEAGCHVSSLFFLPSFASLGAILPLLSRPPPPRPPPRDKRVITLDTIYTRGRGLPLPLHQYQHLKFIKTARRRSSL